MIGFYIKPMSTKLIQINLIKVLNIIVSITEFLMRKIILCVSCINMHRRLVWVAIHMFIVTFATTKHGLNLFKQNKS